MRMVENYIPHPGGIHELHNSYARWTLSADLARYGGKDLEDGQPQGPPATPAPCVTSCPRDVICHTQTPAGLGANATAITVTILAVSLFRDALRDFLGPELK